jgi:hypothetical protein
VVFPEEVVELRTLWTHLKPQAFESREGEIESIRTHFRQDFLRPIEHLIRLVLILLEAPGGLYLVDLLPFLYRKAEIRSEILAVAMVVDPQLQRVFGILLVDGGIVVVFS